MNDWCRGCPKGSIVEKTLLSFHLNPRASLLSIFLGRRVTARHLLCPDHARADGQPRCTPRGAVPGVSVLGGIQGMTEVHVCIII